MSTKAAAKKKTPPVEPGEETAHGTHEPGWMPPAEPGTAAEFDEMLENAAMESNERLATKAETAPEPPKRTRRTRAVIEAERIANLDPITAMGTGMERHDRAVKDAEDDFETARQSLEAAKSARESFRDEHRAKVQAHLDAEEAKRQAYIARGKALIGD